jgi:integrase
MYLFMILSFRAPTDAGAYVAFLLALGAGLRKAEIDGLEWRHINFTKGAIIIDPTEYRALKSEDSAAESVDSISSPTRLTWAGIPRGPSLIPGKCRS